MQAVSQHELEKAQDNNVKGSQYFTPPSRDEFVPENTKEGNVYPEVDLYSSVKAKDTNGSKRRTKSNESGKCKRKKDVLSVDEAHIDAEGLCQGSQPDTVKKFKKNKTATFDTNGLSKPTEEAIQPTEVDIQNQSGQKMEKLLDLSRENSRRGDSVKFDSSKTKKKSRKSKRNHSTIQNQHDDTCVSKVLQEVSVTQEQRNENVKSQSSLLSRQRKRLRNSNDIASGMSDCEVLKGCTTSAAKRTQTKTDPKSPENTAIDTLQLSHLIP